jgi:homoserine dehydrogenase
VRLDLALVGFGNVARRFVALLGERAARLEAECGITTRIVAVRTRRHGTAVDPDGIDPSTLLTAPGSLDGLSAVRAPASTADLIRQLAADSELRRLVVVETTVLDVRAGQPAVDHIRAALSSGAHAITANKGPVAFAYRELDQLARSRGVLFRFESAVMDGIPIFNLVRETLPAVRVIAFRGVVNATTNHILSAMEAGEPFERALARMQAEGIAEADPSLDVDGWDAAAKVAALGNVLMDARTTPPRIARRGIAGLDASMVQRARGRGRRVKLVASGSMAGGRFEGRVEPEELAGEDPLARLDGTSNALLLETDLPGRLLVTELDADLTQTAYGLVSDLVAVRRRL